MALDRGGSTPLWRQLQRELLTRMEAGEFADRFPGELALVEDYGVSRHTVRQALSGLRADGVVVAERGRRPRVATPPPGAPFGADAVPTCFGSWLVPTVPTWLLTIMRTFL